ncbi:unnamed protein product [Periconia digitata]|uniref:Amidase domain-containing protein n=1 Tax=Periconia digitata TaxID=1303443 RepID=A0A9W4UAL9_9PLEO|nr:unnamed protein product [Periconia digitata]
MIYTGVLSVVATATSILPTVFASNSPPFPVSRCQGLDIEDAPIAKLQGYMTEGRLTSHDLTACYIKRIAETNEHLRSVSELNPDALNIARSLDEERARGQLRGPMHGIPFLVKDNYYTNDKHNTSEGTLVLLGGKYIREATAVTKVRAAGGVLLGHATMSEAADHRALTKYASGYSSRTGQGRNIYNLTQPTAGSSSGSVIAVRSNQVPIALGSETYGSLVHPAGQLGLYTVKSTPGLQSRHGIVTGSYWHDTPGTLAHSIADVGLLLDIMSGPDQYDNLTFESVGRISEDGYASKVAGKEALKGMKFGIPWDPYWSTNSHINSPGIREVYDARLEELKGAGAEIYNITKKPFAAIASPYGAGHPADIPPEFNHATAFATLLAAGYAEWLRDWEFPIDDDRYGMSTLAEMAAWNRAHNDTTGALGNGTWWWDTETGQSFYDAGMATNGTLGEAFWTAFGWGRFTARQAIDSAHVHVLEDGTLVELDALLMPNGRNGGYGNACAPLPSYAGYPVASVPIGLDGYSTPFAFGIYGRQWSEGSLIKVSSAMEDLFHWNEKPLWHNVDTAAGPWDAPWPGYTCSMESLDRSSCEEVVGE